jgi:GNAT superfamily N-acetyltransferase
LTALSFKPANIEELDELCVLMRQETSEYLKDSLWQIGMSEAAFRATFKAVGQFYLIVVDDQRAGFYWVEKRESILHLHGIILRREYQGRGLGHQVMKLLEYRHSEGITAIELGVSRFNHQAHHLYEHLGYQVVDHLNGLEFDIMRKPLIDPLWPGKVEIW